VAGLYYSHYTTAVAYCQTWLKFLSSIYVILTNYRHNVKSIIKRSFTISSKEYIVTNILLGI